MGGIIGLNTIGLDGNVVIKRGEGGETINNQNKVVDITENGTTEVVADGGYTGLGKVTINTEVCGETINNQDKVVDITENGTTEITPDSNFTGLSKVTVNVEIESSTPSKPKYTGHADAEGLRAIGWTDEDIAYYQENGVNWNEEDDQYHLVSDDNKALYGVLTASNISTYKDRIVYLPKIDTSSVTDMSNMFTSCYSLTSIPMLDTSSVTDMGSMLRNCYSLTHANLKNVKLAYQLNNAALLSKESLLYLINNESAESAIIITLASYAYDRWATDPDVVAALANHPNISLAK